MSERPTLMTFSKIVVTDPDKLFDFYRRTFGLEATARVREHEGQPNEIFEIIMRASNEAAALVLISFPRRPVPPVGEGIFGVNVIDLPSVVARAKEAGGTIEEDIVSMPQHGVDVAFIRDPEGHLLEVVQTHAD